MATTVCNAGACREGVLEVVWRDAMMMLGWLYMRLICGVFFFLGPCLATLSLPFLFLPTDGAWRFCLGDFLAGGGGDISESGWVRLGCLLVGGSGRRRWRFGEGGGDISVSRRAFLGRLRRLDGARGVGGLSLEGRGGDGGDTCAVVSSRARG